jgi:hypothetical protein
LACPFSRSSPMPHSDRVGSASEDTDGPGSVSSAMSADPIVSLAVVILPVRDPSLPLRNEGGCMELGTALLNTFVVLAVGTALAYVTNDRFRTLRREIELVRDELRTELHAEIGGVRSEIGAEIAGLRSEFGAEIGGLRGEMQAEIGGLRREVGGLRDEVRAEIGGLRGEIAVLRDELRADIRRLDAAIDAIRSDLRQVALAVGARGRAVEG